MNSVLATCQDACFARAMLLLQSSDPEATNQLRAMLDESLDQQKTLEKSVGPKHQPAIKPPKGQGLIQAPRIIATSSEDSDCFSLGCVICKRFEQATGNEIVECQECHGLYHQECHKPSLTNQNVKDPRFVWYCSACNSKLKKTKLPGKAPSTYSGNATTNKDHKGDQNSEMSPFKSWSFLNK